MTVCAWRPRRQASGVLTRALVTRTTTLALMWRWLARTAGTRRGDRLTIWIDDDERPAMVIHMKRRSRWS